MDLYFDSDRDAIEPTTRYFKERIFPHKNRTIDDERMAATLLSPLTKAEIIKKMEY